MLGPNLTTETRRQCGVSALLFSTLFEAGYLTESGALLAANKSQWSSCLYSPQCWDYRHTWGHINFDVGVKGLNFGLYGSTVSSLTHWAISLVPTKASFKELHFSLFCSWCVQMAVVHVDPWELKVSLSGMVTTVLNLLSYLTGFKKIFLSGQCLYSLSE